MTSNASGRPVKRDRRYREADEKIRAAFLQLYEERNIDDITVSGIIRAAGVNRSTFYAHYPDKYALMDAVEEDFLQQMVGIFRNSPTLGLMLGQQPNEEAWKDYFGRLVDLLQANKRLFAGLLEHRDGRFMTRFCNEFAQVLKDAGATSRLGIPVNYQAALLAWSTTGLVEEWARGGFADARERVVQILVRTATAIQTALDTRKP